MSLLFVFIGGFLVGKFVDIKKFIEKIKGLKNDAN